MAAVDIIGTLQKDNDQLRIDTGLDTGFMATVTGAFNGTITFQVLYDSTEGWVNATCFSRLGVAVGNTLASAAGSVMIDVAGAVSLRALMHPWVSGTPECTFTGIGYFAMGAGGSGGAMTVADGADVALGATTDAAVTTDANGTISGKLRGLVKMLADVWDSTAHALKLRGTLTHNNAAPGATNIGVLAAVANAAAPTYIEGDQVLHSTDLTGAQRVVAGGYAPAAPTAAFTRGANQTPYTVGDEVGTAATAPTTIAVGRYNGASGVIQGAQVVYSAYPAVVPALTVLLFSATVTLAGDNAQLNLSDGDAALLIGVIPLSLSQSGQYSAGAPVSAGNQILMGVPTCPIHFVCGASTTNIFAALVTTNAFTPTANSETLILTLQVEQN